MSENVNLKREVEIIARDLGFQHVVIGSLSPLQEQLDRYKDWLERGFAAGMGYLARDPESRVDPARLYPGARSVVIVSVSYYTEKPQPPGFFSGRIARYAVGLDYHAVIRRKLRDLRDALGERLGISVSGKPFIDDVALYEQALAERHGLGFSGKNTLIIGPRLSGSYNFVGELFLDAEIEPDMEYKGTCGQCFRCASGCPTDAIVEEGVVDSNRCISYLTIENRHGIEPAFRPLLGDWVFGCDVCQEVCPYNQRPPETPWREFRPESGVGHYIDLAALFDIKTEEQFRERFAHSAVRRPKRRGLMRNALVVLGNKFAELAVSPSPGALAAEGEALVGRIVDWAVAEDDAMLREHAAWAVSRLPCSDSRKGLERLLSIEPEPEQRAICAAYLDSL